MNLYIIVKNEWRNWQNWHMLFVLRNQYLVYMHIFRDNKKIILMNNNQYLVHLPSLSPQDYFFILLIHNNCTNSRRENFVDNECWRDCWYNDIIHRQMPSPDISQLVLSKMLMINTIGNDTSPLPPPTLLFITASLTKLIYTCSFIATALIHWLYKSDNSNVFCVIPVSHFH